MTLPNLCANWRIYIIQRPLVTTKNLAVLYSICTVIITWPPFMYCISWCTGIDCDDCKCNYLWWLWWSWGWCIYDDCDDHDDHVSMMTVMIMTMKYLWWLWWSWRWCSYDDCDGHEDDVAMMNVTCDEYAILALIIATTYDK